MTKRVDMTGGSDGITSNTNNTTLNFSGAQVGDVAIAITSQANGSNTCNTPTGWTLLRDAARGGSIITQYMFAKEIVSADLADPTVLFQWLGAGRTTGAGIVLYGVDIDSIVLDAGSTVTTSSAASQASPGVETVTDNSDVLCFASTRVGSPPAATITFPSPFVKGMEAKSNQASAANTTSAVGYLIGASPVGDYATGNVTVSPNANGFIVSALAIAPKQTSARRIWDGSAWQPLVTKIIT